jgi:ubiquinone biosynthesis protein
MLFERLHSLYGTVQQTQRLAHIVRVFLKYGYDDLARELHLPTSAWLPWRRFRRKKLETARLPQEVRLRLMCEELGPAFVKFGQFLAARTHALPLEFTVELSKLHDTVAPLAYSEVRKIIEEEIGTPCEEVFAFIEEEPIGSASIAQVHSATLLTGEPVVIKVQRPGIEKTVREDLQILRFFAQRGAGMIEEWGVLQPVRLVDELADNLEKEMDFEAEAGHIDRFARQFADEPTIYVPTVYRRFSTSRVLVMEYIQAIKAKDLGKSAIDRKQTAIRIADLLMKQVFVHGFFHADPHPGNVQVLEDGRICFLDFGLMGYLNLRTREAFADLVYGIAKRNESRASSALLKMCEGDNLVSPNVLETEMSELIHQHFHGSMAELQFDRLVTQLLHLTAKHRLLIPADLVMMLKAFSLVEAFVRELNPEQRLVEQAQPFLERLLKDRYKPERLFNDLGGFAGEMGVMLAELPGEVRRIARQLQSGSARVVFKHEGLEPLTNSLERTTNRLAFALVLAALIIGSSLILHSRIPPLVGDVSVIGVLGFLFAALMGVWLIISMIRHGRM